MDAITLSVEIPKDRHLVLDLQLPEDVPVGSADLTIHPKPAATAVSVGVPSVTASNSAREAARAKLLAAGFLVTNIHAPEGVTALSPEERLRLGTLPPGSPSVDDLINEDRGEY